MKASYNAEHTLSAEFSVPSPSLPQPDLNTSDVIVPGYNQSGIEVQATEQNHEKYALYFHGVKDLSERPEAQKFVNTFEVKDSYGLIYYAVESLIDFNSATDMKFGPVIDEETSTKTALHDAAVTAKENALSGTVKTVATQMALNSMLSHELDEEMLHQEAYIAVVQMQAVILEDRMLRDHIDTQPHIDVVTERSFTAKEKADTHSFGSIVSKLFGYKHLHLTDYLPRSREIPITTTNAMPAQAIKSAGITRP